MDSKGHVIDASCSGSEYLSTDAVPHEPQGSSGAAKDDQ